MTKEFLRNKKDGFIYRWNPILAKNPLCEPVTEEEAFPEKFVKPAQVRRAKQRKAKPLDLSTDDLIEEFKGVSPEIEADASRNLPK